MITSKLIPKLYFRKDKVDCEGRMPLFIRFPRLDGKEPKFSVGKLRLSLDEWDSKTNLPKDEMLRTEIEKEMQRIKLEIHRCIIDEVQIDIPKLNDIVKNVKPADPTDSLFIEHYREFLWKKEKNGQIKQVTVKSHISTIKALEEFNPKLRVKDIDEKSIGRFIEFLKTRKFKSGKDISNLTFGKRLTQIRSVIRYISAKGISIKDPFKTGDIYIKPDQINETYLNEIELSRMICLIDNKELSEAERRVLLMFLLACTTGIRISDMRDLRWRNINLNCTNGTIEFICKKTQRKVFVPLSPMAGEMLCKATEEDPNNVKAESNVFLRIYSPTQINTIIKALAKKVGISKNVTFHVARRTFATLCLQFGVPFYTIQFSLGHKPSNVTERYIKWDTYAANKAAIQLSSFDLEKLKNLA